MTAKNLNNGARMRILRALATDGLQTTNELAAATALTARQVRDNCAAARVEGLLVNVRDDVTNSLAYQITPLGRLRIEGDKACSGARASASVQAAGAAEHDVAPLSIVVKQEASDGGYSAAAPTAETMEDFIRRVPARLVSLQSAQGPLPCANGALRDVAEAGISGSAEPVEESAQPDLDSRVDAIDATEPAPPPEQYAICRAGQGHLADWPLRDMTIDAARQLAIDDAAAIGGEVVLYRCTPVGRAFPRIVFEEA